MKRIDIALYFALLSGALLALPSACGQPAQQRPQTAPASTENAAPPPRNPDLVKFDLDFPGGTPKQLVEAIEKSSGQPLNAVIPDPYADLKLPPLKMNRVNVAGLFEALQLASAEHMQYISGRSPGGGPQYSVFNGSSGFKTQGTPKPDSVWYFFNDRMKLPEQPKVCRFYQLSPYLETYKVEDVTTAIQTGWKMLGETNPPTINFHKDTKLLIAVGEEAKLQLIDSVLSQLSMGKPAAQRESTAAKGTTSKQ